MAFADSTTYFDLGDGTILGMFHEKEFGGLFEFSKNPVRAVWDGVDYPHLVWVNSHNPETRYAIVKKTVAYVIVDEDDEGNAVVEKWNIKEHSLYEKKELL